MPSCRTVEHRCQQFGYGPRCEELAKCAALRAVQLVLNFMSPQLNGVQELAWRELLAGCSCRQSAVTDNALSYASHHMRTYVR